MIFILMFMIELKGTRIKFAYWLECNSATMHVRLECCSNSCNSCFYNQNTIQTTPSKNEWM